MHLLPIGRFSRMTRLSVKALRLYDEIGLLRPAEVDPDSGYRYYAIEQAGRAEAVRALRSVDMPLEEIRAVLDSDDPGAARSILVAHRDRIAGRLAAEERMLSYLEAVIRREDGKMPYQVEIEVTAPQLVAAVRKRTDLSRIGEDIGDGFAALMGAMGREGIGPAGPPLIVYHDVIDGETEGEIEICVPVGRAPSGGGEVYSCELPGGTMATTVHAGPYEEIGAAYQTIMAWIAEHGHGHAGPPREIYLNDPQTVAPEDLLTRIEFPIEAEAG